MMTDWYDKTIQALQLNGKGERTQEAYAGSVRMLTQFFSKTPDQISEQELQDYFFHASFRDGMKKAGFLDKIPADVWQVDWNVNSQAVGSSEASLHYLAPYVFKPVLSPPKGWRSPIIASSRWKTTPSTSNMPNPGAGG